MKFALYIAKRYLFSKKSHNAINVISMISMCGVVVATIALVCTLSVFNGFTDVVAKTFSAFDPDLRITAVQGKVFDASLDVFVQIEKMPEIELVSQSLEENALLRFDDRQEPILLKGVSENFDKLSSFNDLLLDGEFGLRPGGGDVDFGMMGAGLATTMGARAGYLTPLYIYMPKRLGKVNSANPSASFTREPTYVSGVFALNQVDYDEHMYIVSIDLVRKLLQYETEVSSLDLKVAKGENIDRMKSQLQALLGDSYSVKNKMEQQASSFQWVNVEKWITFLILAMIAMIAIFNVVGSLSMLILEKKADIRILQSMGANNNLVASIFLLEGWLITFIGGVIGVLLGLGICLMQEHFGILKIGEPGTSVIDAYPVNVQLSDVMLVFATISILGFVAVLYPIINLKKQLKGTNLFH